MMSEHVSVAVAALQQVGGTVRERIRATAIANVSAFEHDGTVRVPGMARCIVGTKQAAGDTLRSYAAPSCRPSNGHPADPGLKRALDELRFFTTDVKILGVYAAAPERH